MNISINPTEFLIRIWDATVGDLVGDLRRPKPRIEELKEARERLKAKADDIDNSISLAPLKGEIPTNEIQRWLSEVEELEGKAAAIEQDFDRRRCLGGWSWNCFLVNLRVAKRMEKIDKLMATNIPVTTKQPPPSVMEIPTSNSTFGMEEYMRKILGHIDSADATEVIGIYGMGGVGKTTLLKSINNHHKDVARFDHVIWAVASRECKIEKLQKNIAKRLELHMEKDDNEEDLAIKLYDFLKNKDCLLLLDDLWKPLDLAKLGMTHAPEGKRKVVVLTTRNEQVCRSMKAGTRMEIKCLEKEQSWELFRKNVGEDAIGSDPGIERIAHKIAHECAGLPLALITVGKAMSTKKSWESWNDALTLMKQSHMPKVTCEQEEDPMYSGFKLSYNSLGDDDMRGRLLSCALWPEDHLIDKEEIIECWMGLGLIDEVGTMHKAYNRGHSYIETLQAACLLEPGNNKEREVKMHDVIRDMALWMASDCGKKKFKWIVSSQAFEEAGWHEAERVSLMYNDNTSLPSQLPTCSKLSVLMLQHNNKLQEIHGTLIQAMCYLTYLDLEKTRITKIPKEISMLSQLQYLNLSSTEIEELPAELGFLVKLNYLHLREVKDLRTVVEGAISNLSSLKFLDLRGSKYYVDWLDELEGLKESQKCSIGIDITTASDLQRLCSLPHVLIWRLNVNHWGGSANPIQLLDDIINTRQSMEQLKIAHLRTKELQINKGNEEAGGLEYLKHLYLDSIYELEEITWKGVQSQIVFPNLRELNISYCRRLRNVNFVLQLPILSVLQIKSCHEIEELISDEGSSSPTHFGLRMLRLFRLDKLTRISCRSLYFSNLEEIEVRDCPLLIKLPLDMVNRLKGIQCQQKWWDNLELENESIKNSLSSLVTFGKDVLPLVVEQIPTSHSTDGIEECMKIILGRIASPNANEVIGVYGMAGVGKTTLLRSINNHKDVVAKFKRIIWVVASSECNIEMLQWHIADKLGITLCEDNTIRDQASQLYNLLEDENCLLLLDDLWVPLDLRQLGIARGTQGQRKQSRKVVVFSTRNEEVCSAMNAGMKVEIKCLEPKKAWELFRRNTSEATIRSDARIERIARQIAEECAGLPLALITVGMAMSTKTSWEAWNNVQTMMKKEADPMFFAFKLIYNSLEDDIMRDCLLSCALWPEHTSINKDELIECWMGLGLINEEGAINKAYNRGHSHIETLKAACLLEPGNDEEMEVKMHDVIRDKALWVASDYGKKKHKWIVKGGLVPSEILEKEIWHEAERVLLMKNCIASLPNQLSTCSKLSVLMLQHNWELKEIHGTLIQAMCSLTYLDLGNTQIREIPKEIGMLSQLRHLNLSYTCIEELPVELGCLVKLTYLLLRYMFNLRIVAKGAISSLSSLKFLDLRGNRYVDLLDELEGLQGDQKCSICILIQKTTDLQRLGLLQHVLVWQLNVYMFSNSANLNQLLDDIMKSRNTRQSIGQLIIENIELKELLISEGNEEAGGLECLEYLELNGLNEFKEITWKGVLPQIVFPNLRKLKIYKCNKLRNVNWVLQMPSLSVLDISDCDAIEELINDEGSSICLPQIVFPNLCKLHIMMCNELRNVNWVLQMPSLSVLDIVCCVAMEELISDEYNSSYSSFGLKKMRVEGMPTLKRISLRRLNFPNLVEIVVIDCPRLVKLPFENQFSVNRLKVILCKKIWWDNLEWEDVSIKDALLPLMTIF